MIWNDMKKCKELFHEEMLSDDKYSGKDQLL